MNCITDGQWRLLIHFQLLLTEASVLALPDFTIPLVFVHASDYMIGGVRNIGTFFPNKSVNGFAIYANLGINHLINANQPTKCSYLLDSCW